jgi:hypothetical protein
MIPKTYSEWRNCITNECRISLTSTYIDERLNVLTNIDNPETRRFIVLYGNEHLTRVIGWFKNAAQNSVF